MENPLYKMMIANAARHIKNQDPLNTNPDNISIFQISETLALLLCKSKEDVVMDIINCNNIDDE